MQIKENLIKIHWILSSQLGIDINKFFRSILKLPAYYLDWIEFKKQYTGKITFLPCLHDKFKEAGEVKNEYFWQDLLVARDIYLKTPTKHVDIGSRMDGFVAHVASFRDIEVFDIRPISTQIPGVIFTQLDLINLESSIFYSEEGYCDSISCLHALEHFGLGRYGDKINSRGYHQGINVMSKILSKGGTLYLSTPIGKEHVKFNANWVFDPRTIVNCAIDAGLSLKKLTIITAQDDPNDVAVDDETLLKLAQETYNLGLFIFTK